MRIQRENGKNVEWVVTLAYSQDGSPVVTWTNDISQSLAIHPSIIEPIALYLGGCYSVCVGEEEQNEAVQVQNAIAQAARDSRQETEEQARKEKAMDALAAAVPIVAERQQATREARENVRGEARSNAARIR